MKSTLWPEGGLADCTDDTPPHSSTVNPPKYAGRADIAQSLRYLAWAMKTNPRLYPAFEAVADAIWARNPGRAVSPTFVWSSLRQLSRVATEGDQFAVNNNFAPLVARMYALARPDHKIELRDGFLDHLNDAETAQLPPFKPYRNGL